MSQGYSGEDTANGIHTTNGETKNGHTYKLEDVTIEPEPPPRLGVSTQNISGGIFNLMNYIIGAGILGLPYVFNKVGWLGAIFLLCVVATATLLSFTLLLAASTLTQSFSYEKLGHAAWGPRGATLVKCVIIVDSFGTLSAYLIVIGDSFHRFLSAHMVVDEWWMGKPFITFVTLVLLIAPLMFIKNMSKLAFTSLLSLVPLVYLFFVQIWFLAADGSPGGGRAFDSGLFQALPICVFAFASQQALFPIYSEMREIGAASSDMMRVVRWSISLSVLAYFLSGTLGFSQFPNGVTGNVLLSYRSNAGVDILLIAYALSIVFSYPVIVFPCRFSVDRLFFPSHEFSYRRFVIENLSICAIAYLIAIGIPSFSTVLGLFGAFTNTATSYLLPSLFYLSLQQQSFFPLVIDIPFFGIYYSIGGAASQHRKSSIATLSEDVSDADGRKDSNRGLPKANSDSVDDDDEDYRRRDTLDSAEIDVSTETDVEGVPEASRVTEPSNDDRKQHDAPIAERSEVRAQGNALKWAALFLLIVGTLGGLTSGIVVIRTYARGDDG